MNMYGNYLRFGDFVNSLALEDSSSSSSTKSKFKKPMCLRKIQNTSNIHFDFNFIITFHPKSYFCAWNWIKNEKDHLLHDHMAPPHRLCLQRSPHRQHLQKSLLSTTKTIKIKFTFYNKIQNISNLYFLDEFDFINNLQYYRGCAAVHAALLSLLVFLLFDLHTF